jgi:hypothetical protein
VSPGRTSCAPRVVTVEKVKHEVKKDHGKHKSWCKKHKKFADD